jgi:hypothetical protein
MSSSFARVARFALLFTLVVAACAVDDPTFTGIVDAADPDGTQAIDADTTDGPPGTVNLTVARDGTATGTVTSNPGGINCGTQCSAAFAVDSMVTLTATPDTGAEFVGWAGGGCSGTSTCTVTLSAATTVTATFNTATYLVTIDLGGSGTGMVTGASAGIACPGTCTAMVPHGSQLSLTASTGANSLFVGWTVAGMGTSCSGTGSCTTTITGPTTITATFALNQSLEVTKAGTGSGTVTSNPTGINCGVDCNETYPPATSVTLTATPAADSTFAGWSGGGCSGTGTCVVVVNGATLVTATFTLRQYTLTVNKAGLGAGSVTSTPTGINCGATCAALYDAGTTVTLTASPTAGSIFAGWSGGGCTGTSTCQVTLAAATTVTATFTPILHTLTVMRAGAGSGTVTSAPTGINCGADCVEDYAQGTMVTLTAAPSAGSMFTGWSGAGCTGTGTCAVTMIAATTVTATFTAMTVTLTVAKAGTGAGTVSSAPAGISLRRRLHRDVHRRHRRHAERRRRSRHDVRRLERRGLRRHRHLHGDDEHGADRHRDVHAQHLPGHRHQGRHRQRHGHLDPPASPAAPTAPRTSATARCSRSPRRRPPARRSPAGAAVAAPAPAPARSPSPRRSPPPRPSPPTTYTLTVAKTGAGAGTVTSSPAGISCGADCTETVNYGAMVTLSATPAGGSIFSGWSGGGCTGTGSCVVTVTAATTVTADFALAPFALSGHQGRHRRRHRHVVARRHQLRRRLHRALHQRHLGHADRRGWRGLDVHRLERRRLHRHRHLHRHDHRGDQRHRDLHAQHVHAHRVLAGTGTGTVTSSPAGISCGADCNEVVGHGTVVTLTATPIAGSTFTGWSGGGCSGTGTCAVTVTAATTVTATFTLNTYTLAVTKAGTGAGTVSSSPAGITCGATCSASASATAPRWC